jgi:guanylate kinase
MKSGGVLMYEKMNNNMIIVFVGTSGSGRKTIAHQLASELGYRYITSHTTRALRPHEIHGRDYHFISREKFIAADQTGAFLQTAEIDGCFYGIKHSDVEDALKANPVVYVIVNHNAANKFKAQYGDRVVRIFIYANKQLILERLQSRGVSDEIVDHYMEHYAEEVSYRKQCEHVFENLEITATKQNVKKALLSYLPAQG